MGRIEKLVPEAGRHDMAGLRALDADELVGYVADSANPWWRRRTCVHALAGLVQERHVAVLVARVCDPGDVAQVRIALLGVLADRAELLPWLSHDDRRQDGDYGMAEAILKARGVLGDRTSALELATLAASPWRHQRAAGEAGLDALAARHGVETVMADLGDRPEDREFRIRMRHRAGDDVTDALADPDRSVAYLAQSLMSDAARLRDYLDTAPTVEAKLWAAYALYGITEDAAEIRRIYAALGHPRVEVDGLDEELRRVILHEYARGSQRETDPRWRVEALAAEPPIAPDTDEQLRRAIAALTEAGLTPSAPVSCREDHQSGSGTYYVIRYGERALFISTLGPFATGHNVDHTARRALESAGFRWIDDTTGAIPVPGLCVYYFGDRGPLCVETLLFYWQD
jgi:hypothetical protein